MRKGSVLLVVITVAAILVLAAILIFAIYQKENKSPLIQSIPNPLIPTIGPVGTDITVKGVVKDKNAEPLARDGDAILYLKSESGQNVNVLLPARERLCQAKGGLEKFEKVQIGDSVETHGKITLKNSVTICESENHYLKIIGAVETANWETYANKLYGFEVKYPENWNLGYYPSIGSADAASTILFDKFKEEEVVQTEQVTVGLLVSEKENNLPLREFIIQEDMGIDYPMILEFINQEAAKSYTEDRVREMQDTTFREFAALQYGENRIIVEANQVVLLFYIHSFKDISMEDRRTFDQILSTFQFLN